MKAAGPGIEALVDALRDPACYPHPVAGAVQVIETHISFVLIAGGFAYKLKKPLDLGFLDFSTLERRHDCCVSEVRLNRRLAPAIYLGVAAIRWNGSRATVEIAGAVAAGEPEAADAPAAAGVLVEYAVRMRAFGQDDLLDRRLAEGRLEPAMVDAVAETIARFHERIEAAPAQSAFGTPRAVWQPVRANFSTLAGQIRQPAQRALLAGLARWSRGERRRLAGWVSARKAAGFVRECHGDLHLGNIAWVDGEPCVFDCIEFNPDLRWIDVASEVAFAVMDLADRGRADLAWRLLDTWLAITGDHDALRGLRYYLCYRALVRAKVAALRAAQPHLDAAAARRLALEGAAYQRLADELSKARPMVMITHGLSGSGKSYGAQWLLGRLGAVRVRSDVERKRLAAMGPLDRGASGTAIGGGLYATDATRLTYERLESFVRAAVEGALPVIVDAAFLDRANRDRFRALAARLGVPFAILAFSAPVPQLRARVSSRARAGLDASDAGLTVLEHQLATAQPLQPDERGLVVEIDASAERAAGSLAKAAETLAALCARPGG